MVVIRLSRGGAKKRPFYHIVVADKRVHVTVVLLKALVILTLSPQAKTFASLILNALSTGFHKVPSLLIALNT